MGSALGGTGIVNATIVVEVTTVVLNAILSPITIAGWLTGRPMGLAGAGLSTTISVAVAVLMMLVYFVRLERMSCSTSACCGRVGTPGREYWRWGCPRAANSP
jgi:Na+-driven multidrug efflux pump